MIDDPIIEEIHRVRAEIAERFNNDLHAICEAARREQAAGIDTPVALGPPNRQRPETPQKKAS